MVIPPNKYARLPEETKYILLASEGDENAYSLLYTYYYSHLYTSLKYISHSHEDTEEIIQEVFLKVWRSKETLALVRSFEDYVYTIAKNLLFNQLKKKNLDRKLLQSISDQSVSNTGTSPDQELLFKQYFQAALTALDQLSAQKKEIFLLRTQHDFTLDEIAARMNLSRSMVKRHLYAAIGFMKEYLRRHAGDAVFLLLFYFS